MYVGLWVIEGSRVGMINYWRFLIVNYNSVIVVLQNFVTETNCCKNHFLQKNASSGFLQQFVLNISKQKRLWSTLFFLLMFKSSCQCGTSNNIPLFVMYTLLHFEKKSKLMLVTNNVLSLFNSNRIMHRQQFDSANRDVRRRLIREYNSSLTFWNPGRNLSLCGLTKAFDYVVYNTLICKL